MSLHFFFHFCTPLLFSLIFVQDVFGSETASVTASKHRAQTPFFSDLEVFKERNLTLQSKKNSLLASSEGLLSKKLFWTPTISSHIQNSKAFSHRSGSSSDALSSSSESETLLGIEINWNLFQSGKGYQEFKAMKYKAKAEELDLVNEELEQELNAANLIFKYIFLTEMVRVSSEMVKLKQGSLKIAKDRYGQGKLPHHELIKAQVDLNQQENHLRSAQLELFENQSEQQSLFIHSIQTKFWPFTTQTQLLSFDNKSNLNSEKKLSTGEVLAGDDNSFPSSPLSEMQHWLTQSYEASWASAKSLHFPTLDFNLQYNSALNHNHSYQWLGQITLTFPLWSQNQASAQISQSYAQYLNALNTQKATDQKLNQKKTYLYEKIKVARTNLGEAQNNLKLTKQLYQAIEKAFSLGRISFNDLFIEQNRLIESENTLALNQLEFHQSLIEYCALIGIPSSHCLQ